MKAKNSEMKQCILRLGNIEIDFIVQNVKRTGLNAYVYDSFVDYISMYVSDIIVIHKIINNNIK